jgi:release factor H-coupled RctB family protein
VNPTTETQVRLFASPRAGVEAEAVRQLYAVARLPGVRLAAGFPSLKQGRLSPSGAAFVTEDILYPHLAGTDPGCGMALFATTLLRKEIDLDRWSGLPFDLESPWGECVQDFLAERGVDSTAFDASLGTLGGEGHFAELQRVEEVHDLAMFRRLGLGRQQLVLLVHGGSRELGESVLRSMSTGRTGQGVEVGSYSANEFLEQQEATTRWASANRELIARRFAGTLGAEATCLWETAHNGIERRETATGTAWIHRKGTVPTDEGPIVLAGSRGSLSYLVNPRSDTEPHAWSLAQGVGRRWSRTEARLRMRERFAGHPLDETPLGGRVVCGSRDLLYEEAPGAYRDVHATVQDLEEAGLVSVVATFRPILTYKTRGLHG